MYRNKSIIEVWKFLDRSDQLNKSDYLGKSRRRFFQIECFFPKESDLVAFLGSLLLFSWEDRGSRKRTDGGDSVT